MKTLPRMYFLLTVWMLTACNAGPEITFHPSQNPERQDAPYSEAVQVDRLLFLAGQIGMDPATGQPAQGDIKAQTRQTLENIKRVLEYHKTSLDKVVKCTVILADINDFTTFNEVYVTYFPNKPARTTFAAASLAAGALIEIDVIAVK